MKKLFIVLAVLFLVVGIFVVYFLTPLFKTKNPADIKSFEDCQAARFLVVDTKPRECHTKTGQVFTEEYNGTVLQNYIVVTAPVANQVISSPFKVEGKAVGSWYFNDQLYAKLMDENQKIIATKPLKALSSTATTDFVPFVAAIDFPPAETIKGKLIIEKTNSAFTEGESGPLIIPVRFK